MSTQPTDALELLREIYADLVQGAIPNADDPWWQKARAVLAKWGQQAQAAEPVARLVIGKTKGGVSLTHMVVPAAYQLQEGMYALYTAPQPVAREPLTPEQIQDLLLCGDPTDEEMRLIRIGWDAANGIKGGQHVS